MLKLYPVLFVVTIVSSCGVSLSYLGNAYDKTSRVDVYVDASAIKKPYTVMGKGYQENANHMLFTLEQLQEKVIAKAKEKGADAVLFQDYYLSQPGYGYSSVTVTDTLSRGVITTTNSQAQPIVSSGRSILFLKYD